MDFLQLYVVCKENAWLHSPVPQTSACRGVGARRRTGGDCNDVKRVVRSPTDTACVGALSGCLSHAHGVARTTAVDRHIVIMRRERVARKRMRVRWNHRRIEDGTFGPAGIAEHDTARAEKA